MILMGTGYIFICKSVNLYSPYEENHWISTVYSPFIDLTSYPFSLGTYISELLSILPCVLGY